MKHYEVHYAAFRMDHARYAVAVGWTCQGGMNPRLQKSAGMAEYEFVVDEGGIGTDALTPFCVSCPIDGDPRSIVVEDENGRHQVQVMGVEPAA